MKKFIATFLLLTFVMLPVNCTEHSNKTLQKVTITNSAGDVENIYIDEKGNIKKQEKSENDLNFKIYTDSEKEAEHQECIKTVKQLIMNVDEILTENDYSSIDDSKKRKYQEYMKLKLLDGDYAIAFKDASYIAEYHRNKSLMGLVKVDKKILNDEKASVIFYEYRKDYRTHYGMGLKHVLFLEYEKDKYISQYIYDHKGKLLCRQINNDIYVDSNARNMLPNWSKRKIKKAVVYNAEKAERNERIRDGILYTVAAPLMLPAYVAFGAIGIATLPVSLPLAWYLIGKIFK